MYLRVILNLCLTVRILPSSGMFTGKSNPNSFKSNEEFNRKANNFKLHRLTSVCRHQQDCAVFHRQRTQKADS